MRLAIGWACSVIAIGLLVGCDSAPDGKYEGEFRDGKPNGQGRLTWPDGKKYVGEFKHDKLDGQGIEYRADGSVLRSGIWEDGILVRGK